MQGTYYETDLLATIIFLLIIAALIHHAISAEIKNAEKEGVTFQDYCCKNRNGMYPPNK